MTSPLDPFITEPCGPRRFGHNDRFLVVGFAPDLESKRRVLLMKFRTDYVAEALYVKDAFGRGDFYNCAMPTVKETECAA